MSLRRAAPFRLFLQVKKGGAFREKAQRKRAASDVSPGMDISDVYDLLYRLGLTAEDARFFHLSYVLFLAAGQPERLLLPSRWLYPPAAAQYGTTGACIERSIRLEAAAVWLKNRALLQSLSGRTLSGPPSPTAFLAMLAAYLRNGFAA